MGQLQRKLLQNGSISSSQFSYSFSNNAIWKFYGIYFNAIKNNTNLTNFTCQLIISGTGNFVSNNLVYVPSGSDAITNITYSVNYQGQSGATIDNPTFVNNNFFLIPDNLLLTTGGLLSIALLTDNEVMSIDTIIVLIEDISIQF